MIARVPFCLVIACTFPRAASGQSVFPATPPARECPTAQPYCNNTWEAVGSDGKRYWMVRWARKNRSDIVTLRLPLEIIDPIGRINCSFFRNDFPQPSCQQPFELSLLLRAEPRTLQNFTGTSSNPIKLDGTVSALITSPSGGSIGSSINEIYGDVKRIHSRIGDRPGLERSYRGKRGDLTIVGVPRNVSGNRAIGLRDIYYDGHDVDQSNNFISCTYEYSPNSNHQCQQIFVAPHISAIVKVSYGASNLSKWNVINQIVNDTLSSSIYGN